MQKSDGWAGILCIRGENSQMISDIYVMSTWECDNNVLLQQASRFLIKGLQKLGSGGSIEYPCLYFFLEDRIEGENICCNDPVQLGCPQFMLKMMKIRAKKSLLEAGSSLGLYMANGMNQFDSWNNAIPFDLDTAAKYFGEFYIYEEAM